MKLGGRLKAWVKWFESASPSRADDWRLIQWRANYAEAQEIARYVRCAAEHRWQGDDGLKGPSEHGRR